MYSRADKLLSRRNVLDARHAAGRVLVRILFVREIFHRTRRTQDISDLVAIYDSLARNKHRPPIAVLILAALSRLSFFSPRSVGFFSSSRGRASFVIRESLIGDHPSV